MYNSFIRYFTAIILIGFGVVLILDNIGVMKSEFKDMWHFLYPLFFMMYGAVLFFKHFKKGVMRWFFSLVLFVFGGLLLLGRLDFITYRFSDIYKLWPLLIIYIGISIIGRSRNQKTSNVFNKKDTAYESKVIYEKDFTIGNHEYKEENWEVVPMDLWNAAGNYYLDFTKAIIPEEEIPILINSWAGDIKILLPEHLEIRIAAVVKAGEINIFNKSVDGINRKLFYESPGYANALSKLDFKLDLKAGSIKVSHI